jgi:hypothetical protein
MRFFICIAIFLICSFCSFGQEFQFSRVPFKKIDSIQKSQGFERFQYDYTIGVSKNYFPKRKQFRLEQPIVYRKYFEKYFLETSFYLSSPDSLLRLVEYWWRDTTYSLEFTDTIITKNKINISSFLKTKGRNYPENKNHGDKTIWRNKHNYVQQFPVAEGIRVLISWN